MVGLRYIIIYAEVLCVCVWSQPEMWPDLSGTSLSDVFDVISSGAYQTV